MQCAVKEFLSCPQDGQHGQNKTSLKNEDREVSSVRKQKNSFEIAYLCDHKTSGPGTSLICL